MTINYEYILKSQEMERCRNYWLSKGFKRESMACAIIARKDIEVLYTRNAWRSREPGARKFSHKARTLVSLLGKFC